MLKYHALLLLALLSFSTLADSKKMTKDRAFILHGRLNFNVLNHFPKQMKNSRNSSLYSAGNGESRLGLRGEFHLDARQAYRMVYDFELGYDPSFVKSNGEYGRLRLRNLYSDLFTSFGKFTLGQTFSPIFRESIKYDALFTTVAGSPGIDQKRLYDGAYTPGLGGIGLANRPRKFYLGYQTPRFHGLTYALSIDQAQAFADTNKNRSVKGATNLEHILKYNNKINNRQKIEFFVAQYLQEKTKAMNKRLAHKFALLYTYRKETFSTCYTYTLIEKLRGIKSHGIDQLIANYIHKENDYALIAQFQYANDKLYNSMASYVGAKTQRQYSLSLRLLGLKGFMIDFLTSYFDFNDTTQAGSIKHHATSFAEVVRYDF